MYFGNIFTMGFNSKEKENLQITNWTESTECQLNTCSVDKCYQENERYKIESLTFKI